MNAVSSWNFCPLPPDKDGWSRAAWKPADSPSRWERRPFLSQRPVTMEDGVGSQLCHSQAL